MNKEKKVDLLYKKARNQYLDITKKEEAELKKYKIDYNETELFATKKNIREYVTAIDNGCKQTFYDWCCDNKKTDRRMKGSSEKEMERFNQDQTGAAVYFGWITWGMAIYWMLGGHVNAVVCVILGGVLTSIIFKFRRKKVVFSVIVLPILLAYFFSGV